MKFTEEKIIAEGQGKWNIFIDGEEYQELLKKAKRTLISSLEIPGFRKGKAPESEVRKFITPKRLYNEAFRLELKNAHQFATSSKPTLQPISQVEPQLSKANDKEMEISFVFDLKPEIKLGVYKGINKIKKEVADVSEEEILAVLKNHQERFVMEKSREKNDKIQSGDKVIFDFKGMLNGEPFKGGEAKDHELIIGSKQFIPGFEDSMIGLDLGQHTIKVIFPENYSLELGGKETEFELNIKEIKERILPEIDDELVKDLNIKEINNLSQLKEKTKNDLISHKTKNNKNRFVNQILDAIVKDSEISIPQSAINRQIKELKKEFEQEVIKKGLTLKDYKKLSQMTDKDIENEIEGDAKMRLSTYIVVSEIKNIEEFKPNEKQLEDKYNQLAEQFSISVEDLKKALPVEQVNQEIENDLLTDFLFENNGNDFKEENAK